MIEAVLIADDKGLPMYLNNFGKNHIIDSDLLLSFFSALKTFSKSFMNDQKQELKSIHLGKYLLDFESSDFEHLGRLDVIIISSGLTLSTSHAIVAEITELFTIFLEDFFLENPKAQKRMKKGNYPNFSGFDINLELILESLETENYFEVDLRLDIPNSIMKFTNSLFLNNSDFAKMYDYSEKSLIEEFISQYIENNMESALKKRFAKDGQK